LMRIAPATCAYAVLILSLSAGCGRNPAGPTVASGTPSSASPGPRHALSRREFSLQGWHDDVFHYLPSVSVSAPSTGATVNVQRLDFRTSNGGAHTRLARHVVGITPSV